MGDPFSAVKDAIEEDKLGALRDLEPEQSALNESHWEEKTPMEMRRKICFAARIRTVGENWDIVARILEYEDKDKVRHEIVEDHASEWEAEQHHAHMVIQRNYLPKRAIQGLLNAINIFTDGKYKEKGIKYKDAANIAVRASNSASKMMKAAKKLSEEDDDKVFDEVTEKNMKSLHKQLNEMANG